MWAEASNPATSAALERQGQIIARVSQTGRPWLNLQDGYESQVVYQGKGRAALTAEGLVKPRSLSSKDINGDGFPDLVSGYAANDGGRIVIRFGDPEAFGPTRPETIEGINNGRFPATFLAEAAVYMVPESPDYLDIGDFDRDGRL